MSHPNLLQSTKDEILSVRDFVTSDIPQQVDGGFLGDVLMLPVLADAALAHDLVPACDRVIAAVRAYLLWATPDRKNELTHACDLLDLYLGGK